MNELPFPLLFAEPVDMRESAFDLAAALGRMRPLRPTGHCDQALIIASRTDQHADEVMLELMSRNVPVRRLNVDGYPESLHFTVETNGRSTPRALVATPQGEIVLNEIRTVWMRRPIINLLHSGGLGSVEAVDARTRNELFLHGVLSLLKDRFWMNSPRSLWAAEPKIGQLRVAQSVGLTVPRTLITTDPHRAEQFYRECGGRVVVKVFRGQVGSPRTQFQMILTSRVKPEHLEHLHRVKHTPCIFQQEVSKEAELRISVFGRRVFAVEISSASDMLDWRDQSARATYRPADLPAHVEAACLDMLDHYGLASAGIDMIRRPDGRHVFLELNAHHDWLWIQRITGLAMSSAVADLLRPSPHMAHALSA